MGRLTTDDSEGAAQIFEELFAELQALRDIVHEEIGEAIQPMKVSIPAARVTLLNLLDVATEQNLKPTALSEMPDTEDPEDWEWVATTELVKAINTGMHALVRDMSTLRGAVAAESWGRELDVLRFRAAWSALADRQIEGDGAALRITDEPDGVVGLKVLFEPPMTNPFKDGNSDADLTPAQIVVGNMMAFAFQQRDVEPAE